MVLGEKHGTNYLPCTNILTYPPKYVVYRLSNITLPAKYLSIQYLGGMSYGSNQHLQKYYPIH